MKRHDQRALQLVLVLVSGGLLDGCSGDDGFDCTDDVRASTVITLKDEGGALVDDAQVSYTVGARGPQACDGWSDGLYQCGAETPGRFRITAVRGTEMGSAEVVVERDRCHVMTEMVEIVIR